MTLEERGTRIAAAHIYAEDRLGLKLHPRQIQVLKDLFPLKRGKRSRVSFRCANEVGKTSYTAVAAILYLLEMLKGQAISTAGVWMQVEQQLVPSLKHHQAKYPAWRFLDASIKIDGVDRYVGFSARDEGFAQGFHRKDGMPLLAIVDEAAAVDAKIIASVEDRCNPDYFLIMGSPLDPSGAFYDIETKLSKFYTHHHLNQMMCLKEDGYWLERSDIERKIAKWDEKSQFVQSNVFGEFSDIVAGALVSLGEYDSCMASPPKWQVFPNERHAFLDFAGGRAKNVFAMRLGNRVWIEKKWVDMNTMSACGEFLAVFKALNAKYGLLAEEVEGDADGLGLPMIQRLQEMGFNLLKFHGGSACRFSAEYQNAISEAWGEGAGRIKRKDMILPDDPDFKGQVLTRKLKRNSTGKFQLESKEEMAARGVDSPDEADAVFGAMMPVPMSNSRQMSPGDQSLPHNRESIWQERELGQEETPSLPGAWFG